MKVVAKSVKGKEFFYNPRSAHFVSEKNAQLICEVLNKINHDLKADEIWHIHDVDKYDVAFDYAQEYKFIINSKGCLVERKPRNYLK